MSTIKVNTITKRTGSTLTLGESGTTVTLACGATQTGFGRTGTVDWCTTAKTSPFTATSGSGFFVDTSSGAVTVTLPASPSAGDIVSINDLKGKFGCNAVTLGRNGSKIKGKCSCGTLDKARESVTVIYSGSCQGWVNTADANITCGSAIAFTYNVRYLVVAGGGGGGATCGGMGGAAGGGAGGYRTVCTANFSVLSGTSFPVTVGAGGAGGSTPPSFSSSCATGSNGTNSIFSTITSAAGGFGAFAAPSGCREGGPGGSGGGSGGGPGTSGGTGNTPPVAPPQGNDGGDNGGPARGAGGGGAAAAAGDAANPGNFTGGSGSNTTILGSIPQVPSYGEPGPNPGRYFGGGGGGGLYDTSPETPTASNNGGLGGGGDGGTPGAGSAGTANTGGGGGGGGRSGSAPIGSRGGGAGGSGIVIIRHATADASPSTSGGNVVATCGSDTIRIFTADGTFTS
tara:strand:- start:9 stop:1376 length:1368 start_codon:yes stop_codon:yes gene_type:complete